MISLIFGDNDFLRDQRVKTLKQQFPELEIVDGEKISENELGQLLAGASLFQTETRHILIKYLLRNKPTFDKLIDYLNQDLPLENDIHLLEAKFDKRTGWFKTLKKKGQLFECQNLGDPTKASTVNTAKKWLEQYLKTEQIPFEKAAASELVERIGVNQSVIVNEVKRLENLGKITAENVKKYTEAAPSANAFAVLNLAIKGDRDALTCQLNDLKLSAQPQEFLGLLGHQLWTLSATFYGQKQGLTNEEIAAKIGVNPFLIRQNQAAVQNINQNRLQQIINSIKQVDQDSKTSSIDLWNALESTLLTICMAGQGR